MYMAAFFSILLEDLFYGFPVVICETSLILNAYVTFEKKFSTWHKLRALKA